jgi:hypothetical protein
MEFLPMVDMVISSAQKRRYVTGFHPETALFRRGGVNPQACL